MSNPLFDRKPLSQTIHGRIAMMSLPASRIYPPGMSDGEYRGKQPAEKPEPSAMNFASNWPSVMLC